MYPYLHFVHFVNSTHYLAVVILNHFDPIYLCIAIVIVNFIVFFNNVVTFATFPTFNLMANLVILLIVAIRQSDHNDHYYWRCS